jgi:prepilin-type N-terminal cleavage/methylation domain-containing protein
VSANPTLAGPIVDFMFVLSNSAASQKGFTFNEVLVAMSLVVVAVLGYVLTTLGVIRGNTTSDHYTVAVNLAHDKIEELKAVAKLVNEDRCPGSGDRGITAVGALGGIFDRCWKISDSPLGANLKQIDVTISWRDYENREVTFSTLMYTG